MANLRPDGPYFWASWLSKYRHDHHCGWQVWFQARHSRNSWDREPNDFNLESWTKEHNDLVSETAQEWADKGYVVMLESQTKFNLTGRTATVAGKPDLVVWRDKDVVVIDVKTGQQRTSDVVQVLLYMWALPLQFLSFFRDKELRGQLVYRDHVMDIPVDGLNDQCKRDFANTVNTLASSTEPLRHPDPDWCKRCPITAKDCPDRMKSSPLGQELVGTTSLF